MGNKDEIIRLKEEIERKREKLNLIVVNKIDREEILKFSQELDILIMEYTSYVTRSNEK